MDYTPSSWHGAAACGDKGTLASKKDQPLEESARSSGPEAPATVVCVKIAWRSTVYGTPPQHCRLNRRDHLSGFNAKRGDFQDGGERVGTAHGGINRQSVDQLAFLQKQQMAWTKARPQAAPRQNGPCRMALCIVTRDTSSQPQQALDPHVLYGPDLRAVRQVSPTGEAGVLWCRS